MRVLLLIAGRSQRFWPLSEKTLFPVCGTNLLEVTTGRLKETGLDDITLIGGSHNLEDVHRQYPEFPTVEQRDLELGMRGALLDALPSCGNESVMIVCVNDVIDPAGYKSLIEATSDSNTSGAILAQKVERYLPGGYLKLEGDQILEVIEKPGEGNEPSDLVNIVAHIHKDASILLETLRVTPSGTDDGYEQALTKLFKDFVYKAVPYESVWNAV
ncbi:NTP transferase domain-containing protein, partial [Patescibacteria group bacterium]|nr:NTP transferase domain-containing protein [Patescibacteria group bacterium]